MDFKKYLELNLEKYADLAVKVGINLQEREGLSISCNEHSLELARMISKKAYAAGAKHVFIKFDDDIVKKQRYENAKDYVFESVPAWYIDSLEQMYKDGYAMLNLISPNPELLKDIDPALVAKDSETMAKASAKVMHYIMADKNKWSILAVPNPTWAKMVYPDLSEDEALKSLWKSIFKACRIDKDDPISAWKEHSESLKSYSDYLNKNSFVKFEYRAEGTNLQVEMPENQIWAGGSAKQANGVEFMPNIPTEEIFCAPNYAKVNGSLKATKPLSIRGQIIDGFGFTFKDGVVVDFYAKEGYETLKMLLDADEGARRLGEIALVPDNSPISNTKLLFKDTLFDENASCHFALGRAYPTCIKGGEDMDEDELLKKGLNHSNIHVDFMVGSKDLEIIGYNADGSAVKIFEKGNWVF